MAQTPPGEAETNLSYHVKALVQQTPARSAGTLLAPARSRAVPAGSGRPGRALWMDLLRGLAVLLIILYHAAYLTEQAGLSVPGWVGEVNSSLAPFRIPTLVALSGMLLGPSLAKGARRYFSGKWSSIGWPYLVWVGVYAAITLPSADVAVVYLRGGTYLWFLLFLLVFYVAAWLVRRVPTVLLVTLPLAASVLAPTGSKYTERVLYMFGLFMLGHLLRSNPWLWRWVTRSRLAPVCGAFLIVAQFAVVGGGDYGPRTFLGALGGLLLGVQAAIRVGDQGWTAPVRYAGRNSLVYYVVHFPTAMLTIALVTRGGLVDGAVVAVVAAVAALLMSTVLTRYRQVPPVRWLFEAPSRRPSPPTARV